MNWKHWIALLLQFLGAEPTYSTNVAEGLKTIKVTAELADSRVLSTSTQLTVQAQEREEDESAFERLGLPGFEGILAVVSILAVVLFNLRRRY